MHLLQVWNRDHQTLRWQRVLTASLYQAAFSWLLVMAAKTHVRGGYCSTPAFSFPVRITAPGEVCRFTRLAAQEVMGGGGSCKFCTNSTTALLISLQSAKRVGCMPTVCREMQHYIGELMCPPFGSGGRSKGRRERPIQFERFCRSL